MTALVKYVNNNAIKLPQKPDMMAVVTQHVAFVGTCSFIMFISNVKQETLVHAPKLWAEEIFKRAQIIVSIFTTVHLIGQWENNRGVPRRSLVSRENIYTTTDFVEPQLL